MPSDSKEIHAFGAIPTGTAERLVRLALAADPDPTATATVRALDAARAFGEALVRVRTVSEALQIRARLAAVVAEFIGLEDAALAHANALVPREEEEGRR